MAPKTHYINAYPFGSVLGGRNGNVGDYRYGGAGGQEMDNEVSGAGNSYTAEYWQYDSRLGRRWNIDPVIKNHESPYACFANNPILLIDPTGADTLINNNGQGNVLIWINYNREKMDYEKMTKDNVNWDIIEVYDIEGLNKYVDEYLKDSEYSSLQNVVIRSHGNRSYIAYDNIYVSSIGINGKDAKKYSTTGTTGDERNDLFFKSMQNIASKMSTVGHGQLVFTSCYTANYSLNGSDLSRELSEILFKSNNQISIYFNYNAGVYFNNEDDEVYCKDLSVISYSWRKFSKINTKLVEQDVHKAIYLNFKQSDEDALGFGKRPSGKKRW